MHLFFNFYHQHTLLIADSQLVLAMLGMGATLTVGQFRNILRTPASIGLMLLLQFGVMPAIALWVARAAGLPDEIAIGLVLLMALPSGSQSNIITYLGRGNVPLSITSTCASTVICLVITPLVLQFFASQQLPEDFVVPTDKTVWSIATKLLIPLAFGMAIGARFPQAKETVSRWAIGGSLVALSAIVVGALGGGQIKVFEYGWQTPALMIGVIVGSLLITYWITLLLRYPQAEAFTLAIEVAMRNGNLGVALCIPLFGLPTSGSTQEPNLLYQGGLYATLFGGGAMMFIGLAAVARRHLRFARQRRAGQPEV